jgi:5-methylcytosine-specific restriction endonuclease McrA
MGDHATATSDPPQERAAQRVRPWELRKRPPPGLPRKNRERRRAFLAAWGGACVYCGRSLKAERDDPGDEQPITIEHIVPRVDGGGDNLANLAPACAACNSERNSHPLRPDFAERLLDKAAAVRDVLTGSGDGPRTEA